MASGYIEKMCCFFIAILLFGIAKQTSAEILFCEVDNPQVGYWIIRSLNDGLEPGYNDHCQPPTGETFRVSVSTGACGFVTGDSCSGCTQSLACPIGNEILEGTLKPYCDYYIINSNCGVPPEFESGCCKVDTRGTNTCHLPISYMSASFSQVATQVLQWVCYDQCPNDPDKTEPGECGCGTPDTDTDGNGVLDCKDQNFGPPC